MRIALALIVLLAPLAHADDSPALKLGKFRGGAVTGLQTGVFSDETGQRTTWRFEVVTASATATELVIPVTVPRDLAITRISIQLAGETEPLIGEAHAIEHARASYQQVVDTLRDPALLEWVSSSETTTTMQLRVFPVTRERSATVTIQAGAASNVTNERSLVAVPTLPQMRMATRSHDAIVPGVDDDALAARATCPQRALDRPLVKAVPDQHQLRAARVATPRVAIRQ